MIYFDSDISKSTNTVVYFDWKTVIYIYVCGKCRTQFTLPMEKSVTFTGAYANEIIPSINRSFVYKAKEGRYVRTWNIFESACFWNDNKYITKIKLTHTSCLLLVHKLTYNYWYYSLTKHLSDILLVLDLAEKEQSPAISDSNYIVPKLI
jgi:hypothetical protein